MTAVSAPLCADRHRTASSLGIACCAQWWCAAHLPSLSKLCCQLAPRMRHTMRFAAAMSAQRTGAANITTGPISDAAVNEWGCFVTFSGGFNRPTQSLTYSAFLEKPPYPAQMDYPLGMAPASVVRNGASDFPFPGVSCFQSTGNNPWLQITLDPTFSRDVTGVAIYSGMCVLRAFEFLNAAYDRRAGASHLTICVCGISMFQNVTGTAQSVNWGYTGIYRHAQVQQPAAAAPLTAQCELAS